MPLTPEEQAEMTRLRAELSSAPQAQAKSSGLSDAERDEMVSLQKQLGHSPGFLDSEVPIVGGTPRTYIRGALNTLPTAGMVAGGLGGSALGTMAAPGVGTVAGEALGAGAGDAAGEGLKAFGKKYILGEDPGDVATNAAHGAIEGGVSALGGRALLGGARVLANTPAAQGTVALLSKAAKAGTKYVLPSGISEVASTVASKLGSKPAQKVYYYGIGKPAADASGDALKALGIGAAARQFSPWDQAK